MNTKSMSRAKLKNKLIASFFILALTPTLVVGIFSCYKSINAIKSKTMKYSQQILRETSINIESNINSINMICDEILLMEPVQYSLQNYKDLDFVTKGNNIVNITDYFTGRYQILKYLNDVEIVTNDFEFLYNYGYCEFKKEELKSIAKMADELDGKIGWSYIFLNNKSNILVYRKLKSEKTRKGIGYLFIALDEQLFTNIYKDINLGEKSEVFIIDSQGMVISSIGTDVKMGKKYKQQNLIEELLRHNKENENIFTLVTDKEKYLVPNMPLNNEEWFLVSTIPYFNFNKESHEIMLNIIWVSIVCILAIAFLSITISKIIWRPLNKLVSHMKDVQKGKFDIEIDCNGNDEISYLTTNFKNMVVQIERLINEVKKEQDEKREIEIQMLQAQINPHFLFNTLNSLKWTAMISQANSVSKGLGALAEILRSTIIEKNELISIKDEVKNLDNYIIIQKIRYGTSFDITYDIDNQLLDCKILKFLLQPIVENSIIHGQNNIDHMLEIRLICYKEYDKIKIIIEDNGSGLDENKLMKELDTDKKNKEKISSIGIYNVSERIKLTFGEEYGLYIKGEKNLGTTVTIYIPIIND